MYNGKIALFGAGATGRGHLAELLYRDGIRDITFIDKNEKLINMLRAGSYNVRLLTDNQSPGRVVTVDGYKAISRNDETAVKDTFCRSGIVLTAVIAENLPDIAELVSACISERKKRGIETEMNVICCENLDHASSWLRSMVYERLRDEEKAYCDRYIGFPDAMISRVVPIPAQDSTDIVTEDYNEWTVDVYAFKGDHPEIPSIDLVKNLDARLERKLWIHNGGHATLAYAAWLRGFRYIHEALCDTDLAEFTVGVLKEIGDCVHHKYPGDFTRAEISEYEHDLGMRGAIAEIKDDISRVVRDPLRKLRINDRLLAPAVYAATHGLSYELLARSIVNATRYDSENDAESVNMRSIIRDKGYTCFINETLGLCCCPVLANKLISLYEIKN